MSFIYPFIYDTWGDRRGLQRVGFAVRDLYLQWIAVADKNYLELATAEIAILIGKIWRRSIGSPMDPDLMDPVAYKLILKFYNHKLPFDYALPMHLIMSARRDLIRLVVKPMLPEQGDKSIRDFSYHPFMSPADIEHQIFVEEMKELLLDHIENNTRVDEDKRKACRYLATTLMENKMPSPLILLKKYGIPYKEQQFYVDFTSVILRNELYRLRDSIPSLYNTERKPFIPPGDEDDESEKNWDTETVSRLCDF